MTNSRNREDIVRAKLIEVARQRSLMTYSDAARLVGLPAVSVGPLVLDRINEREHTEGRPLLSALVVSKSTGMPGAGFYGIASRLGLYNDEEPFDYWRQELQRVYSAWPP